MMCRGSVAELLNGATKRSKMVVRLRLHPLQPPLPKNPASATNRYAWIPLFSLMNLSQLCLFKYSSSTAVILPPVGQQLLLYTSLLKTSNQHTADGMPTYITSKQTIKRQTSIM